MDDYETVGVFRTSPPAYIALGRLRAEGLEARLLDEHVVRALAVEGIRLQVPRRHAETAKRILDTDYSADLDADFQSNAD